MAHTAIEVTLVVAGALRTHSYPAAVDVRFELERAAEPDDAEPAADQQQRQPAAGEGHGDLALPCLEESRVPRPA